MYHSMVLEFRRRSANGLQYAGSYAFGNGNRSSYLSKRIDPSPFATAVRRRCRARVEVRRRVLLPFGRGQRFGGDVNGVVDRIIGGWQLAGIARVQTGRLLDLGNVRLVGMDQQDLQEMFKLRIETAGRVFMFPQEIIDESFKAFSVSATSASGYGSLGPPSGRYIAPADSLDCIERIRGEGNCGLQSVVLTGPLVKQFDLSVVKRVEIVGRINAEFRVDALNVFNNVNFIPVTGISTTNNRSAGAQLAAYEVTALTGTNSARVLQLAARVRW